MLTIYAYLYICIFIYKMQKTMTDRQEKKYGAGPDPHFLCQVFAL